MRCITKLPHFGLTLALLCSFVPATHAQENEDVANNSVSSEVTEPAPNLVRDQLYQEILGEAARLEAQGNLLKKVVRFVKPSVVHLEAHKTGTRGSLPVDEAGSGVIVAYKEKYYVISNRHVIDQAQNINIKIHLNDGRILRPTQVLTDRETDIAVMEISGEQLVPAQLADSSKIEIGDFVLAVGSPFGLSQSVTYGIISAKGRFDLQLGRRGLKYQNFMQTDAAINPGNSGGPLINMRGQVVGINTAIASNSGGNDGIAFTIPINSVMGIATQLIDDGNVSRSFLGVVLDSAYTNEVAQDLGMFIARGTRVNGLTPGSPAEKAGIVKGDIIINFNGIEIQDDNHLVNVVSLTPMQSNVPIRILRDGKQKQLKVTLVNRKALKTSTE